MIGKLAVTVLGCFAVLWAPYLRSLDSTLQVLSRLFPVGRGLYEDKVANVWCTVSPVSSAFFYPLLLCTNLVLCCVTM